MPRREDDDVAPHPSTLRTRTLIQAGGFLLAAIATLAVFLTDNPKLLKVAVVAVAWAFVLATFAAGRRGTDRMAARAREAELRHAYEVELDREVTARREYELELENELRREAEDAMRGELDALRSDISALTGLRDEVARVAALRGDIAALSSLRDEVARVAALRDDVAALTSIRDDVAALTSLRDELGQLTELRADMGRLRAELTEQLSSEMLVERIVMRTQASRLSADPARPDPHGRTLDASPSWTDDAPPRELTGGWPAVRLDEQPRETQQFEQVRVERSPARPPVPAPGTVASWRVSTYDPPPYEQRSHEAPSWGTPSWQPPATAAFGSAAPPPAFVPPTPPGYRPPPVPPLSSPASSAAEPRLWSEEPAPATSAFPLSAPPRTAAPPATALTPITPPVEPPSPLEWLAARSLLDPSPAAARPEVAARRRRRDDDGPAPDPAAAPTTVRPAVPAGPPPARIDDRGGHRVAVRPDLTDGRPAPEQEKRLDEILAENGVSPAAGGRRRRRYRDEDEPDDVLARVLGRN